MVIAMLITKRGCRMGLSHLATQVRRFDFAFCRHGASNRMRVISSAGGSTSAARSDEGDSGGGIARQFGARRAAGQVAFHLGPAWPPQRAVHVIADQDFHLCAVHTTSFCFRSSRASSARPRLIRDFTVPSGISSTSAISRYSISCKSRKITASRKSGDKLLQRGLQDLAGLPAGHSLVRARRGRGARSSSMGS